MAGESLEDVAQQAATDLDAAVKVCIEQGAAVHARGARGARHRHGAVGGRVDEGLAAHPVTQQRHRCRVRESGQRLGVQLACQHEVAVGQREAE